MKFSEKIKKLREDKKMTQEDLAREAYVSRNAVSKWENDKGYPNIESLKLLCKIFDVTMDELLNDENLMEITIDAMENNQKLEKKYNYTFDSIFIILYVLVALALREWIFYEDPTSGIGYFLLLGPVSLMTLGAIYGMVFSRWQHAIISGAFGLLVVSILEAIFFYYLNFLWDLVYYILFLIIVLIVFAIKLKRKIAIGYEVNRILSIIIFVITAYIFILLMNSSVLTEQNQGEHPTIGGFRTGPLFYILIFVIPLVLEIYWVIMSWLKISKPLKKEK
jgi:transcriptional regulator with XRE-family HTH domain